MQTVYALSMPNDEEGRSTYVVGHFATRDLALTIGALEIGNRSMGLCNGYVTEITVYSTLVEVAASIDNLRLTAMLSPAERASLAKAKALAKLTPEDRKVLGL